MARGERTELAASLARRQVVAFSGLQNRDRKEAAFATRLVENRDGFRCTVRLPQ